MASQAGSGDMRGGYESTVRWERDSEGAARDAGANFGAAHESTPSHALSHLQQPPPKPVLISARGAEGVGQGVASTHSGAVNRHCWRAATASQANDRVRAAKARASTARAGRAGVGVKRRSPDNTEAEESDVDSECAPASKCGGRGKVQGVSHRGKPVQSGVGCDQTLTSMSDVVLRAHM